MTEKKSKLVSLVNMENVSAIRILADRLETSSEEVTVLIEELLSEGKIHGSMTDDGERFFKSEIKLSDAPVIPGGDSTPAFMKFDTRPGIITSIIGLVVIAFGSIVMGTFSEESDIDLLVSFTPMDYGDYADNYFILADKFEALFNRPVDLITEKSLSNPYFIESVNRTKTRLYGN